MSLTLLYNFANNYVALLGSTGTVNEYISALRYSRGTTAKNPVGMRTLVVSVYRLSLTGSRWSTPKNLRGA